MGVPYVHELWIRYCYHLLLPVLHPHFQSYTQQTTYDTNYDIHSASLVSEGGGSTGQSPHRASPFHDFNDYHTYKRSTALYSTVQRERSSVPHARAICSTRTIRDTGTLFLEPLWPRMKTVTFTALQCIKGTYYDAPHTSSSFPPFQRLSPSVDPSCRAIKHYARQIAPWRKKPAECKKTKSAPSCRRSPLHDPSPLTTTNHRTGIACNLYRTVRTPPVSGNKYLKIRLLLHNHPVSGRTLPRSRI